MASTVSLVSIVFLSIFIESFVSFATNVKARTCEEMDLFRSLSCCCYYTITDYGSWGSWGSWSICSKPCHYGYKSRKKDCQYKKYQGSYRNVPCTGGNHEDRKTCNIGISCSSKF